MLAGQTLRASDGYEVALFPCEALYLTPNRNPDEHDVLALDFLPRNTSGQTITQMPCYAPFSGRIVYTGNDHNCILESNDKVHFPDGSLEKMRVLVAHSEVAPVLGTTYLQGQLFYTTGNYGQSTGEHLHMEISRALDNQYFNTGGVGLKNAIHMWDGLYVNDTALLRPKDYPWLVYIPPTPPGEKKPHRFPWPVYMRILREKKRL